MKTLGWYSRIISLDLQKKVLEITNCPTSRGIFPRKFPGIPGLQWNLNQITTLSRGHNPYPASQSKLFLPFLFEKTIPSPKQSTSVVFFIIEGQKKPQGASVVGL